MPGNMPAAGAASQALAVAPVPIAGPSADPDESPATKAAPTQPKEDDAAKEPEKPAEGNGKNPENPTPAAPAAAPVDPDESPATSAKVAKPKEDPTSTSEGDTAAGASKPS